MDFFCKGVCYFYAPLEKGGILFCNCRSVDFQVTCSKFKVKPLFSAHCVVRSISFAPFTWSIPNLVQGLPLMSRWSLLIFRSHDQRSRSNRSSQPTVLSGQYLLPLHLINTKLSAGVALNEKMIPIDFQVTCSKVKVKPLFSAHCVVWSISFAYFTWSIPNLVQGLPSMSRWSLLIFRSHVLRSRSNYSWA